MGGFNIGPVYWNASSLSAKVSDLGVFSLHYSHYSCNVFFCKLINNTLPFITGERAPNNRLSLQWFLMFRVCHYLFSSYHKISSTLRRRNLKTEVSLWKRITSVFRSQYAGEIWKHNNHWSFGFVFVENSVREITCDYRDANVFEKLRFSKWFSSTRKRCRH